MTIVRTAAATATAATAAPSLECVPEGLYERLHERERVCVCRVCMHEGDCTRARVCGSAHAAAAAAAASSAATAPNFELAPATNLEIYSTTARPLPSPFPTLLPRPLPLRSRRCDCERITAFIRDICTRAACVCLRVRACVMCPYMHVRT